MPRRLMTGVVVFGLLLSGGIFVYAQEATPEVDVLNQTLKDKKQNIDQINDKIGEYKKKIEQKEAEKASLAGQLDLISNRTAKTELEIEETKAEIDLVDTEVSYLTDQISALNVKLEQDRKLIASIL
ncbi:MAG: hypothetical protein AAB431_00295, partial [Patescibacteria group bacterium]